MYTEKVVAELHRYSKRLGKVIDILEGKDTNEAPEPPPPSPKPVHHRSPAAIRHMRLGQKRRWERIRKGQKHAA